MQKLASQFPNHPRDFTLLYLGTTWLPRDYRALLRLARRKRIPIVVNQDGVGYPGWANTDTDAVNDRLRHAMFAADHVIYQSAFSRRSAQAFIGEPECPWEILPNAVDVSVFTPGASSPVRGPVVLLGGDQTQAYRLELAVRTHALVRQQHPDARLLVTGRLASDVRPLLAQLDVADSVVFLGEYTQRDAPQIFRRAHLLLHTKVQDPCPTLVIEAMATGLPVVYPASGGTVELVGDAAGVGVPHAASWERDEPPAPEELAAAVDRVLSDHARYAAAARARAVEHFALEPWLERHGEIFADLARR